jgi:hypothetical protein
MRTKFLAIASTLLMVAGLFSLGAGPATAGNEGNTNEITDWMNYFPGTTCYKDDAKYGSVADNDMSVTLSGASAWRALIVKSGNVAGDFGNGNKVYENPISGTAYLPPLNNAGIQGEVSHWIVCVRQGTTPPATVAPPLKLDVTVTDLCAVDRDLLTVNTSTEGVKYTVSWNQRVATVTASITDLSKYVFADAATTSWTFTFTNVPCTSPVTPGDPVAQNEACVDGKTASGSIWVDIKDGVAYTIDGTTVTKATTPVEPGDHVVRATALEGHVLAGDTQWPYSVTVDRAENCDFQFPDLAVVTPLVTSNNLTCTAAGSFTLGEADGIADAIIWKIDGNLVTAGTHAVTKKGTHTVTAVPGEEHGFAENIDNPSTWTLSFTDPTDCGDLVTLALPGETLAATGADAGAVNLGLLFASGLLLLGGALVITEKRFRFGKK